VSRNLLPALSIPELAMPGSNHVDFLARALHSTIYFKGKTRLVDLVGRLSHLWNPSGTFPLRDGRAVTVDLGDRIQRLMWGGAYEPGVTRCIRALLRPGDSFVDVGAHIGFFSLTASAAVGPSGKIYSFEADGDLFKTLQANAIDCPWLVPYWQAVWKHSGPMTFSNPRQKGESGWGKLAAVREGGHNTTVNATSLDDWHENVGFPPIRGIKIDAEGSEPFILEGAGRVIQTVRPFIVIELNESLLRKVGHSAHGIITLLHDYRYHVLAITSRKLEKPIKRLQDYSEILCLPFERFEEAKRALGPI
jgi:FkbM family methyltransferase